MTNKRELSIVIDASPHCCVSAWQVGRRQVGGNNKLDRPPLEIAHRFARERRGHRVASASTRKSSEILGPAGATDTNMAVLVDPLSCRSDHCASWYVVDTDSNCG